MGWQRWQVQATVSWVVVSSGWDSGGKQMATFFLDANSPEEAALVTFDMAFIGPRPDYDVESRRVACSLHGEHSGWTSRVVLDGKVVEETDQERKDRDWAQ